MLIKSYGNLGTCVIKEKGKERKRYWFKNGKLKGVRIYSYKNHWSVKKDIYES